MNLQATDPTSTALAPIHNMVNGLTAGLLSLSGDVAKLAIALIVIALPLGAAALIWGAFHSGHSHYGKLILGRVLLALALLLIGLPVAYSYISQTYGVAVPALPGITH